MPRLELMGDYDGTFRKAVIVDDEGKQVAIGHIETTATAGMVASAIEGTEGQIELGLRFVGQPT